MHSMAASNSLLRSLCSRLWASSTKTISKLSPAFSFKSLLSRSWVRTNALFFRSTEYISGWVTTLPNPSMSA
ncbi:hypothetical protein D3C76_1446690 [compost metagenome]